MKLLVTACILVELLYHTIEATDCTGLPSFNVLADQLQTRVDSDGGEGPTPITAQDGPYYTCQVQGSTMGTYQELSVIMTYTVNDDATNTIRVGQFELDCTETGGDNVWNGRSNSLDSVSNSLDYMNIEVMTNCSECTSSAGNDHHCVACNSACNIGLMRCTGSSSSDCCVAFEDDGVCSPDLNCNEDNFVANEQNNYTCACDSRCTAGFTFNATLCSCLLTDICLADSPCDNGVCVLGSSPDQYTCNCTGTNYIGTNCSECTLSCDAPGYIPDSNCLECVLNDACEAFVPCQNGGTCILNSAPDNFSCNCTNSYDPGSNCSECSFLCGVGFVNDNCSSCVLSDICVASNPCQNGGQCSLDSAPDQYTCRCDSDTGFTGENCSVCSVMCTEAGYVLNSDTCRCELNDICEADQPCVNGGTCISGSPPTEYQCRCANEFGGANCTVCMLPCQNGTVDSNCQSCDCHTGYTGVSCDIIDFCANGCSDRGTCVNLQNGFECTCNTGYAGVDCSECGDGFGAVGDNCAELSNDDSSSLQWWHIALPIILLLVIATVIIVIVVVAVLVYRRRKSVYV